MSHETEDERTSRIREAQIRDRSGGGNKKPQLKAITKKPSTSRQAKKSSSTTATPDLLGIPPGATRDVVIGLAYGLIPAILVVILLPGALKLLVFVVLGIAAGAGYMLGAATD